MLVRQKKSSNNSAIVGGESACLASLCVHYEPGQLALIISNCKNLVSKLVF